MDEIPKEHHFMIYAKKKGIAPANTQGLCLPYFERVRSVMIPITTSDTASIRPFIILILPVTSVGICSTKLKNC